MNQRIIRWLSLCVLMMPLAMLGWHLSVFWSLSPEYRFGWLVPPLAAYLFYRRWNTLPPVAEPAGQGADLAILLCSILLLPLWVFRTATPDWCGISYGMAALVIVFTFALLARMGGWRLAWWMAFPVFFLVCAIPWPQQLEAAVVQSLMRFVAGVSAELALWFGIAAEARGNMVLLGGAAIDISEACSGLRSLQSLVMAALFIGELRRMPLVARGVLVIVGGGLAVLANVVRNLALVLVVYHSGTAVEEKWHDPTGWIVLLASFFALLLIAKHLSKAGQFLQTGGPRLQPLPGWLVGSLGVWFVATLLGNEAWFRWHEQGVHSVRCLEVLWPRDKVEFRRNSVPDRARAMTLCSEAASASWREKEGSHWSFLTLRWAPGRTAPQSARMHLPDICLKAIGAEPLREFKPVEIAVPGGAMGFRSWVFRFGDRPLFVFYGLWEEVDETQFKDVLAQDWSPWGRMKGALTGRRNLGQQSVEIAFDGYSSQAEAVEALKARLPALLDITSKTGTVRATGLGGLAE